MVASGTRFSMRPVAVALALLGAACGALLLTQTFAGIQTRFGDPAQAFPTVKAAPAFPTVKVGGASLATATGVRDPMHTAPGTLGGATSGAGSPAQHGIIGPAQNGMTGTAQPIVRGGGWTVMIAPGGGGPPHRPGRGGCLRCM